MNPFFIFIISLIIVASLLRVDLFFTILYLVMGAYITLRVWSDQIIKNLHIKRIFIDHAFIGDIIDVDLIIQNGSWLPIPWLTVNESTHWLLTTASSLRRVITLKGNEKKIFKYTLQAKKRGYYKVGPAEARTGDLLGMKSTSMRLEGDYLIVYPKLIPLSDLGLPVCSPQAILPAPLPFFEDPAHITGIRQYQWGDNPRHIHWPATARTGETKVKQFRPAISRETFIFLNFSRADYSNKYQETSLELSVTVAASITFHILTQEKLPVGFDTTATDPLTKEINNFHLPANKEQGQLMQILEVLARIQPVDDDVFLSNLRLKATHQSWGTTIVIITGQESEALSKVLIWLESRGFHPVLILINQYLESDRTSGISVPTFQIRQEKDIESWGLK